MADIPGLEALRLALFPIAGASEAQGPFYLNVSGTVNIGGGGGGGGGTSSIDNSSFTAGGSSITVAGGYHGGREVPSGNAAALQIDGSGNLQVNIVSGGAGFATGAVYGSPQFPVYAIASVNVVNTLTVLGSVNVIGTVNVANGAAFASVGVYGIAGAPVYNIGSVNVVNVMTVNFGGAAATVWLANAAANTAFGTVGVYGSVSVLGTTNIANFPGVQVIDTRASLMPTQWIISGTASGQFNIAGTAPDGLRVWFSSYQLTPTATLDAQWMSPSGVAITGSMHLLPGTTVAFAGGLNSPVLFGSINSGIYLRSAGTQNIGGVAVGWVA